MEAAIGARPVAAYMGRDLLCVMDSEQTVRAALYSEASIYVPED